MTDVKTETPTVELTLAPTFDAAPVPTLANTSGDALAPASDAAEVPAKLDDSMLTEEEKKMVESFSQQINVRDTAMVLQYGAGAQKKMADFSDTALESVRTKDLGEVGGLLSDAVTELRSFDATEEKGLFGFFKKGANKIESLRARYDKAEANVDKIVKALQGHQMTLMKDAATLDKMYELNLTYFKELTMYILAGKKKLAEVREVELKELVDKAKATGRAEDAQAAQDLDAMCTRFEKKLSDLDLTRTIAMQTAPQIRLVQNNEIDAGREDTNHHREYHSAVEKPDGSSARHREFTRGRARTNRRHQHDERLAEEEFRNAAHLHRRGGKGIGARHRRYRNAEAD